MNVITSAAYQRRRPGPITASGGCNSCRRTILFAMSTHRHQCHINIRSCWPKPAPTATLSTADRAHVPHRSLLMSSNPLLGCLQYLQQLVLLSSSLWNYVVLPGYQGRCRHLHGHGRAGHAPLYTPVRCLLKGTCLRRVSALRPIHSGCPCSALPSLLQLLNDNARGCSPICTAPDTHAITPTQHYCSPFAVAGLLRVMLTCVTHGPTYHD